MGDRTSSPKPTPQQIPENVDTDVQVKEEEPTVASVPLSSPTASVAQTNVLSDPPSSSPARQIRRTESQRRALLRNDPQVQEAEPNRVLCRACERWIRLSSHTNYSHANWQSHKQRCPAGVRPRSVCKTPSISKFSPNSRIATTERQIVLFNDPQAKIFTQKHVHCGNCLTDVALGDDVDYDLTNWVEHKEQCVPMVPPITPQGSMSRKERTIPAPSTSSPPPVSARRTLPSPSSVREGSSRHSTETTAVAQSSPVGVTAGTKRGREEESEEEANTAGDERPQNRPRTETYTRPKEDAPTVFGWFMQPLKEFARGFREGLGST